MEVIPRIVEHYVNDEGDHFEKWMGKVRDGKAYAKINIRLKRVAQGNFGDHKPVGEGVIELREHEGAGYRVYLGIDSGKAIVLTGGTKDTQDADIKRAKDLWREYSDA